MIDQLDKDGFAIVPAVLRSAAVERLTAAVLPVAALLKPRRGGVRNLPDAVAEVRALAASDEIMALVKTALGERAFPVRGILFDKTGGANWKVPWHQDLTIAVREHRDVPGFGPWTVKDAVPHVQPPVEILQNMLAVRVHLDRCGPDNGPLCVLPGSHRHGRLAPEAIDAIRKVTDAVMCVANPGDAILMRPLLLHASPAATVPSHRRVIHLEYAACDLPRPLAWRGFLAS